MDPNETLRRLRELSTELNTAVEHLADAGEGDSNDEEIEAGQEVRDVAINIAEHVAALDGWLSKGGFLPQDWSRGVWRLGEARPAFPREDVLRKEQ